MGGFNVDPEEMGRLRTALQGSSSSFLERSLPENPGVDVFGDPGVDAAMTSFVGDARAHHYRFGNRFSHLATEVGDFSDHTVATDEEWSTTLGLSYEAVDVIAPLRRVFGTD